MKKGMKMFLAGAAVAAAGALVLRKYRDSYEQIVDDEAVEAVEEDDFVPTEEIADDFDYLVEDQDQIMFHE